MITSYSIEKNVVKCHFDDMCYGIARIVRGDGAVMKSVRGEDRPLYHESLAMRDATELTLCPEFNGFFNNIKQNKEKE